ncbi:MAG: hypothetical protein WA118_04225 [Carboxydocellales bacterium]
MASRIGGSGSLTRKPIFRVGLILFGVIVIFVTAQQLSIPKSFGQYGYFRGDNISEWAAQEGNYAPGNSCEKCHQNEVQILDQGDHKGLDCQICHGPGLKHLQKFQTSKLKVEGTKELKVEGTEELCGICHRKMSGRSGDKIKTIELGIHNGGVVCIRCHNSHQPWAQLGGRQS